MTSPKRDFWLCAAVAVYVVNVAFWGGYFLVKIWSAA